MTIVINLVLLAAAVDTLVIILKYKDLERDALQILTQWQKIDTLTNNILLKRVSMSDGASFRLLSEWERRTLVLSPVFSTIQQ